MGKKKFITVKQRTETLGKRVAHLENEMLRELGDIGDIARQFILLKDYMVEELAKIRKDMGILKRQIKSKGNSTNEKSKSRKTKRKSS